jgi:hypothetical protein
LRAGRGVNGSAAEKFTVRNPWRRPRPAQSCSTSKEEDEEEEEGLFPYKIQFIISIHACVMVVSLKTERRLVVS